MTDFGWDYPPGVSDRDFTDGPPHDPECDCPACEEARLPKCRKCGYPLHNAVHEGLCADCLRGAQQIWGFHTMESLAIMAWRYGIDARVMDVMKAERERGITARDCDRERFRLGLPPVPPDQSLDDMDKICDSCPALAGCPNWGHGKGCDCRVCKEAGIS